jgi:hypothetical protein
MSELALGELRQLDPRYVDAQRVTWWIVVAVVGSTLLGAWVVGLVTGEIPARAVPWLLAASAGALLALACLAARMPQLVWEHTRYCVADFGLEIRRGIVWHSVVHVPRLRIQHTDVIQGPIARRFGLATLRVHTAGTEHATIELDGLDHAMALAVRDSLLAVEGGDGA